MHPPPFQKYFPRPFYPPMPAMGPMRHPFPPPQWQPPPMGAYPPIQPPMSNSSYRFPNSFNRPNFDEEEVNFSIQIFSL